MRPRSWLALAILGAGLIAPGRGRAAEHRPGVSVVAVSAGGLHSCAVDAEGGVWCWGSNRDGQLGTGDTKERLRPTKVAGLSKARSVDAGAASYTCAVLADGGVSCWGSVDGDIDPGSNVPRAVPGLRDIAAVSVSKRHACALSRAGAVLCWGLGASGELGDGSRNPSRTPVPVKGLPPMTDIDAGFNGTCAVGRDGRMWCWGENTSGQLGDGTSRSRLVPRVTASIVRLRTLGDSKGSVTRCALDRDGGVWCWGNHPEGSKPLRKPGLVGITALTNTCAIASDGALRCWGWNESGQVGDGRAEAADRAPAKVLDGAIAVSSSGLHVCAITKDRRLFCWGANMGGQLGTGDTRDRSTPAEILLGP